MSDYEIVKEFIEVLIEKTNYNVDTNIDNITYKILALHDMQNEEPLRDGEVLEVIRTFTAYMRDECKRIV